MAFAICSGVPTKRCLVTVRGRRSADCPAICSSTAGIAFVSCLPLGLTGFEDDSDAASEAPPMQAQAYRFVMAPGAHLESPWKDLDQLMERAARPLADLVPGLELLLTKLLWVVP